MRQDTSIDIISKHSKQSYSRHFHGNKIARQLMFSPTLAKLEFPKYFGDDSTKCFSYVEQFFEYQGTFEA